MSECRATALVSNDTAQLELAPHRASLFNSDNSSTLIGCAKTRKPTPLGTGLVASQEVTVIYAMDLFRNKEERHASIRSA